MPMVLRSMPSCRSHADSVWNTSMNGRPQENPSASEAAMRGLRYTRMALPQPRHHGSFMMRTPHHSGFGRTPASPMQNHQKEFIELALARNALRFGEFTL